eukprot:1103554-Pyramimonas_sp.AAC.1
MCSSATAATTSITAATTFAISFRGAVDLISTRIAIWTMRGSRRGRKKSTAAAFDGVIVEAMAVEVAVARCWPSANTAGGPRQNLFSASFQ